jgi:hypothetical protein
MKRCKLCDVPISKDLEELSKGGILEEYKNGYCLDCWLLIQMNSLLRFIKKVKK